MSKRILIFLTACVLLTGCGKPVKMKTQEVSLEENIEIITKNSADVSEENSQEETSIQIKTLTKNEKNEPIYKTYTNEDGKVIREIHTNAADNFDITIPNGVTVYSLISVKNVMSEDGKHGGAQVPYIILNDDGTFEFVFGSTDEYKTSGKYTSDNVQLTLQSDKTYVFDYKDNGTISFNEDLSDKIPVENEKAYIIDKHATFFLTK